MRTRFKLFVLSVCMWCVTAYPNFKDALPNGNHVPHPCKVNYMWHGVGHHNPIGGGIRNQFGMDFKEAGKSWTTALCRKDSDGDGLTNGKELGDPECVWTSGYLPTRITGITHPGICTLQDGSICDDDKSWVDCEVADGLEDCEVLKEPETLNITIRFPETAVPAQETSYMCTVFDLPSDTDYHLMAYVPVIDNAHVMHHILLYGCDPKYPVPANELNKVEKCGMGARSQCSTIIGLWGVGFPGYCINGPMGFRIGGTKGYKQAAFEFHWNNPELVSNYRDSSGMTLYYTPKLRPNDAGILMTGQTYLEIPPGLKSYTVEGKCTSECSKVIMKDNINVFWAANHMHYLGHSMKIVVNRNNKLFTTLTSDEIYNYDSPVEHKYTTAIEVMPGDEIVTRCTFKSLSRPKTTFYGDATSDEMCFGFMAYYPADNLQLPVCTAWKEISTCGWLSGNHKGCDIYNFLNSSHVDTLATRKLVKDNCKAFGNCLKECKPVLEKLFKEHPCLKSDVYDLIREQAKRLTNLKLIEFIAAIDSCKLEMSTSNEDTNRSSHRNAMSAMGISVLIAVQLLFN